MDKYDVVVTNLAIQYGPKIILETTIHAVEPVEQQWLILSVPKSDGENITGYCSIKDIRLILYGDFSPFVEDNTVFNVFIAPLQKGITKTLVFEFDVSEHVLIFQLCSTAVTYIDTSKQIQKGNFTEAIEITGTNHEKQSVMDSYAEVRLRRYLEITNKKSSPLRKKYLMAAKVVLNQLNSIIHTDTYNELNAEIKKLEEYKSARANTKESPPGEKALIPRTNAPLKRLF